MCVCACRHQGVFQNFKGARKVFHLSAFLTHRSVSNQQILTPVHLALKIQREAERCFICSKVKRLSWIAIMLHKVIITDDEMLWVRGEGKISAGDKIIKLIVPSSFASGGNCRRDERMSLESDSTPGDPHSEMERRRFLEMHCVLKCRT